MLMHIDEKHEILLMLVHKFFHSLSFWHKQFIELVLFFKIILDIQTVHILADEPTTVIATDHTIDIDHGNNFNGNFFK